MKDEPEVAAFGGYVDAVRAFENDFVADLDRAFVRYFEAGHRAEQGRLAAARRTEQRHDLAAVQRQRDTFEDRIVAVFEMEVLDGELGHGKSFASI